MANSFLHKIAHILVILTLLVPWGVHRLHPARAQDPESPAPESSGIFRTRVILAHSTDRARLDAMLGEST